MHAYRTCLAAQLAFTWMVGVFASGQTLQITSPGDGTVVHPGEVFSVTVNSPDTPFQFVGLVGEGPIGIVGSKTSVPAHFSLTIPADFNICRKYSITAMGVIVPGKNVDSRPIEIDVERPDLPLKLSNGMPPPSFRSPGESLPTLLFATFPDGQVLDVRASSKVTYSSTNPSVAEIDEQGAVTSRMPGKGIVLATYRLEGQKIQLAIPVTVHPFALNPSAYSLSFGSQMVGMRGEKSLRLVNTTLGPLKVLEVNVTPYFSETDDCVSSSPLKSHRACTVTVAFTPSETGPRVGSLTVIDESGSRTIIPLTGSGQ